MRATADGDAKPRTRCLITHTPVAGEAERTGVRSGAADLESRVVTRLERTAEPLV